MSAGEKAIPDFLDRVIDFPEGITFELGDPITTYRSCHDGTPFEARIVCLGTQTNPPSPEQYIIKVKVQLPAEGQTAHPGPSTTTAHELKALTTFRTATTPYAPHLVAFKSTVQDSRGPLPGGYITFTVMTKMPGTSLFGKYWNMTNGERDEIVTEALKALRSVYDLGIEPVDRGLRNVMWDAETKHCSIIDFELWNEVAARFADQTKELQRWGLARRPPPKDWWDEWKLQER